MSDWEGNILLWIQENLRSEVITPVFQVITTLGNYGMIWIFLVFVFLCVKETRKVGLLSGISLAVTFLINNLIAKNFFHRTRPYEVYELLQPLIEKPLDYSFPSGHTAAAFGTAVVLFLLLRDWRGISAMILAVFMGFSRLYVGVHYPTDVLGGALLGTGVALLVIKIAHCRIDKT